MPAGCNCGPNSPLAQALGCHCVRHGILQSLPVSCHFRGCKVPLFRTVSGAISSELALPFLPFTNRKNLKTNFSVKSALHRDGKILRFYQPCVERDVAKVYSR